MLLAGFLVELCVYCNLFQETHIIKIHVLTCFCEIQSVGVIKLPKWRAAGEGKKISSQSDLGLVSFGKYFSLPC